MTPQREAEIRKLAAGFGQGETPEERQSRWENAAWASGRPIDRNALRVYMDVADGEQLLLADDWAKSMSAADAEIRRLKARVAELERPAVDLKRNEIRSSYAESMAMAREDRDYEGAFNVECQLREREEQWKLEDAAGGGV